MSEESDESLPGPSHGLTGGHASGFVHRDDGREYGLDPRGVGERGRMIQELFAHAPMGVSLKDRQGRFVWVNAALAAQHGVDDGRELIGRRVYDLLPTEQADEVSRLDDLVMESGASREDEVERVGRGGIRLIHQVSRFPVRDEADNVVGVGSIHRDVTAQRDFDDRVRQAERLRMIGQMSSGVAHDFNNLFTVVLGNLELIQDGLPQDPTLRRRADAALRAVQRGATLTSQLLFFSRLHPLVVGSVDVNRLILSMGPRFLRVLGEGITLENSLSPGLSPALLDADQLQRALVHLADNARDAMSGTGTLNIHTTSVRVGEHDRLASGDLVAGDYVQIVVTDDGPGMTPEVVRLAVEPFFTTRRDVGGSGMGLSMVYGFVKQSGGHLTLDSSRAGTRVTLYLPVSRAPAIVADRPPEPALSTSEQTILVLDESREVRKYVVDYLSGLGYAVLSAGDERAAREILSGVRRIDLLFTDVVLGGGGRGASVAEWATARQPDLRVLYTSGYARICGDSFSAAGIPFINKPYSSSELARRVAEALVR